MSGGWGEAYANLHKQQREEKAKKESDFLKRAIIAIRIEYVKAVDEWDGDVCLEESRIIDVLRKEFRVDS